MPTYEHFQDAKKSETLPENKSVGACLTCAYWDAPTPRTEAMNPEVARCVQHDLKAYALLVNGSSACNKWEEHPKAGPDAKAYAERGES
jgi:hypothetical protein